MLDVPRTGLDPSSILRSLFPTTFESVPASAAETRIEQPDDHAYIPDETRVLNLLQESGGMTWQEEIRASFDWSPSKTSRRLSELEDSERVNRYQIGRRKVVCLPDQKPPTLKQ